MRKTELRFGDRYAMTVGRKLTTVVLLHEHPMGGYVVLNEKSKRQIRLYTVRRLRELPK